MTKKVLFSLVLLWISGHLLATPGFRMNPDTNEPSIDCNLDAPTSLHGIRIGTTNADIAWNAVAGAGGYRVKVFQKVGGIYVPLSEANHFSTTMTVTGLIPGSEHRVTVAGMCGDSIGGWTVSKRESSLELPKVILDLDIVQLIPMPNLALATCTASGYFNCCYAFNDDNGKRLWIKVIYKATNACNIHPIRLSYSGGATLYKKTDQVSQCSTLLNTLNMGYYNGQPVYQQGIDLAYGVIRDLGLHVDVLKIETNGTPISPVTEVCITNLAPNHYDYEVYEFHGLGFAPPNGGERSEILEDPAMQVHPVSPFSESLDLIAPKVGDLSVKIHLYDLNGKLEITRQYTTGQGDFSLPTAHLLPGLYFLRVESGGEIQTFKVVKTHN